MAMENSTPGVRKCPCSMTVTAVVAIVFGLATILSGGMVLFGTGEAKRAAGRVVPFVLWFNFLSGFAYIAAGVGLWRMRRWGFWLAAALASAIAIVFGLFGLHVAGGGAFEPRTLYALIFRLTVWCGIAALACYVYACPRFAARR
jgi:hypothetical protein